MPNWLSTSEIKAFLARDGQRGRLLMLTLFRALERDPRSAIEVGNYPDPPPANISRSLFEAKAPFHRFAPTPEVVAIVERIDTWLTQAIATGQPWVAKCDHDGRVVRLRNIKTLEDALVLAAEDEAREQAAQDVREDLARGNGPENAREVIRFDNGITAVEILTRAGLEFEGRHMKSCFRTRLHYYAGRLARRRHKYYSLRDAGGYPRVTLETLGGRVVECKARVNRNPFVRYGAELDGLALAMSWDASELRNLQEPEERNASGIGDLVRDRDLRLAAEHLPLPRTLFVEGDVEAVGLAELTTLPGVMLVQGNLLLRDCPNLFRMPQLLRVDGDMTVANCRALRQLAQRLSVGGALSISSCPRARLDPAHTAVGTTITVTRCPNVALGTGAPPGRGRTRGRALRAPSRASREPKGR